MEARWLRWIKASIIKHFTSSLTFKITVEGQDSLVKDQKNIFELRLDGPDISNPVKDEFILNYIVGFVCKVVADEKDLYSAERVIGELSTSFSDICVKKWDDGEAFIGTLRLIPFANSHVRVIQISKSSAAIRVQQFVVEGRYKIEIE